MPTRTTLITVTAIIFAAAGSFAYVPHTDAPAPLRSDVPAIVTATTAPAPAIQPVPSAPALPPIADSGAAAPAPAAASATATLVIAGAPFAIPVSPDESVLDAMRALSSAGSLAFTSTEYPGLGTFIDSINGQKSAGGMNWMLYVNGIPASRGVSSEVVHAHDVIEWKYEK